LWIDKQIFIPTENRSCSSHLINGYFNSNAINRIEASRFGIQRTGREIAEWILAVTEEFSSKPMSALQKATMISEDYKNKNGIEKRDFEDLYGS